MCSSSSQVFSLKNMSCLTSKHRRGHLFGNNRLWGSRHRSPRPRPQNKKCWVRAIKWCSPSSVSCFLQGTGRERYGISLYALCFTSEDKATRAYQETWYTVTTDAVLRICSILKVLPGMFSIDQRTNIGPMLKTAKRRFPRRNRRRWSAKSCLRATPQNLWCAGGNPSVGWWVNHETPIFDGKIHGFLQNVPPT